jgi:hypothetical protein
MARAARLQLRSCPLCGSRCVARIEREMIVAPHLHVALLCGSCETWRRVLTTTWTADAFERRLERDRGRMAGLLERLGHEAEGSDYARAADS